MFYSLLGVITSWTDFINKYLDPTNKKENANTAALLGKTFNIISIVLWVILGVVGAFGAIYAIYLGVQLARAEEQGKRDDAKKHLITVCIAIGVTIALIVIFNTVLPMICGAFLKDSEGHTQDVNDKGGSSLISPLLNIVKAYC